ncbi:ATP-binding cassette domain-containing protein [Alphaproteobacteria bacterium]|nr:zinc ABC transporter ATP-binding protein ZnuC [Rhodobiaceae bacterium]MDA8523872.1 ATP-binding cassette domain-containing protein [Alphaproteobacteria bacterium]RPF98248.1 MAG: ABC transporter ATP-binding protein [Rhizobiales bacterium TMED162]MDA8545028.1 ATP-binding cassette domain-containing protein [Alphaproteobacteria bacterium]MDA8625640.1 ATP-binding cassette domain-containing protein [Alphaproteobacteria bacterium]|tara:strand:+ start:404 stop:1159 length:756 start_codon:yes stop_codon:yes gene_type:complete
MSEPLIEATELCVRRHGGLVLDNVSLTLGERDFITLIGPNGAGKSVLLRHLLKLESPNSGTVKHRQGIRIGYVPERFQIDPTLPMPVRRFLTLNNNQSAEAVEALALEANCGGLLDKPLANLSGGELQRVLLARALSGNPHVLMLDEPAQNLDVSGQLQFYQLIDALYEKRNLSVLMVSHDLHMVMSSTRQVVCLYHHICCSGAPDSVARDPEFVQMFGAEMAQMMAVYQHSHAHDHTHDHEHAHLHEIKP